MHSVLRVFLCFGLLAAWVAAAPQPKLVKRGVFSVGRVQNPNFVRHDGPKQLLKSLRKYRNDIPPELMEAIKNNAPAVDTSETPSFADKLTNSSFAGKALSNSTTAAAAAPGTGVVAASPEAGDVEYLSPVDIGGQTLLLDFDSGSADLWVFSTGLPAASALNHTLYNPQKSTSAKVIAGAKFTISYGDGSNANGIVGTDTVNIGGAIAPAQAVEMATTVSKSFTQDFNNNGLVGLAFSKLNTVKPQRQKTFFDNVIPTLAEPVFTADLRKGVAGSYTFGSIDQTKYTGAMAWTPVNTTQGFWQFPSTKFAVGTGAPVAGNPVGQAIADTGTTLIIADPTVVKGYYAKVPSAKNNAQVGGITVDCNAQLPDLMLAVGDNYMARVKGSDINYAQVEGNTCFGGVQSGGPSNLAIYGDIFFKSQFVAFNGGNNSLGMAEHAV